MKLSQDHINMFKLLIDAARQGNLALLATLDSNDQPCAIIVATRGVDPDDGEEEGELLPLARLILDADAELKPPEVDCEMVSMTVDMSIVKGS